MGGGLGCGSSGSASHRDGTCMEPTTTSIHFLTVLWSTGLGGRFLRFCGVGGVPVLRGLPAWLVVGAGCWLGARRGLPVRSLVVRMAAPSRLGFSSHGGWSPSGRVPRAEVKAEDPRANLGISSVSQLSHFVGQRRSQPGFKGEGKDPTSGSSRDSRASGDNTNVFTTSTCRPDPGRHRRSCRRGNALLFAPPLPAISPSPHAARAPGMGQALLRPGGLPRG